MGSAPKLLKYEDFFSLDEWHRLLAAAPTTREVALLWLMAGCGLRISEVAALKVNHLDDAGGYLHIVNGKGGKRRTFIHPRPVLAPYAHLQGKDSGDIFEAEIRAISRPGRSKGYWTKLPRMQGPGDKNGQSEAAKEDHAASSEA